MGERTQPDGRVRGAGGLLRAVAALALGLAVAGCGEVAERRHTRFDPDLGWVNVPDLRLPDFYGPGRNLTINARGFRGTGQIARQVVPGQVRIVCSGDSFTLGYGVDDADTWCARLAALEPRFESVNMGQGGYGLGQSYLWYARDGSSLEHQVQVFAFIAADFARLLSPRFQGYGKPVVDWREGALVVDGVPVPDVPRWGRWWLARWDALRLRLGGDDSERMGGSIRRAAGGIFDELARLHHERGSQLLLVYLPMRGEQRRPVEPRLTRFVAERARALGVPFVDLGEAIRRLAPADAAELYLRDGEVDYPGADGHLGAVGNAWVARQLAAVILSLPVDAIPDRPAPDLWDR